jgi:hypothetical protein
LVRSLDDLYRQMWQELRHSIGKLRSLVASVSKQPGQNGYIPNSVDSSSTPPSRSWMSPGCTFAGKKRHILVDTLGLLLHAIAVRCSARPTDLRRQIGDQVTDIDHLIDQGFESWSAIALPHRGSRLSSNHTTKAIDATPTAAHA